MNRFRVHYTHGNQRAEERTVVSAETKGEAAAIFARHHPRSRLKRVEEIGGVPAAKRQVPETAADNQEPAGEISEETRERLRSQVAELRTRLRVAPRQGLVRLTAGSDGRWFARGKEARLHGESRDLVDGRMTPANRAAFQPGWDEQQQRMQPPTEAQIAESAETARRLSEWAKANLG